MCISEQLSVIKELDVKSKFHKINICNNESFHNFLRNHRKILYAGDYEIGGRCVKLHWLNDCLDVGNIPRIYVVLNKAACIDVSWYYVDRHKDYVNGTMHLCEKSYGMWVRTYKLADIGNDYVVTDMISVRSKSNGKFLRLDSESVFVTAKSVVNDIAEAYDMYTAAANLAVSHASKDESDRIDRIISTN